MDYFNCNEEVIFDLRCFEIIIGNILSFLPYDELVAIDLYLQRMYSKYTEMRIEQIKQQCLLWRYTLIHLRNARNVTLVLHEESTIEPATICPVIHNYVNFGNITALNLNIHFNFSNFHCPLAMYDYDFTYLTNLKHLYIANALLEFINVNPRTLVSLRLNEVYVERNVTSFRNAFNRLLENAINLRYLNIDQFPEDFKTRAMNLEYITLAPNNMDLHSLAEFLYAHRFSLQIIRLQQYRIRLVKFLRFLRLHSRFVFPDVHTLIFHFDDLSRLRRELGINKLPLCKMVFPNLKSLVFAISSAEQLQNYISFCTYPGIKDITLRPDSSMSMTNSAPFINTEDFYAQLNALNEHYRGQHSFSFAPRDITSTY